MSAFVDRLAKVSWEHGDSFTKFEELPWPMQQQVRQQVRAILAEARDAMTDEMAAPIAYNYLIRDADLKIAFQAMIDAALAPDKVSP